MDEMLGKMASDLRAKRTADQRARRAASNRTFGLKPGMSPDEIHNAIMRKAENKDA